MKSGENYNKSRRNFFKTIAAGLLAVPLLNACREKAVTLLIRLSGTNHILGHRLRIKNFPKPTRQIKIPYLIVGGGISGLSAARELTRKGISDFLIVELENHLGGNSSHGENPYSKYPLGAHYLPLPNYDDKILMQFLEEEKIILGYDESGLPVFDETQLVIAPEERLYYKNNWQETLVPRLGNSVAEENELTRFFSMMTAFRLKKDDSGNYWFTIPIAKSSQMETVRQLDAITMKQWLVESNFKTEVLYNYVDYCCRDDFGLGIDHISAYAGIHYFASRKQDATKEKSESVLTWPEGNARLASHLKKYTKGKSLKNHLVYHIKPENNQVVVSAFDGIGNTSVTIIADKVIMATPQFVNQYVFDGRKEITKDFHYAPWLLATLVVSALNDNGSFPLCWDNVIYGAQGLGYIYDQNQSLQQNQEKKVITYYRSFSAADCGKSRREIYKKDKAFWKQMVFDELKTAHPDIEAVTQSIDIHLLGHGMISPVPGFLFGESKRKAAQPIQNLVYFAHSDLSGISIFEEAFHQGINAVNQMLYGTTLDS